MKPNPTIAIVGATGLVGNEILVCLEESSLDFSDLRLLASKDSEGEIYSCRDTEYKVESIEDDSFEGVDIAFFALESSLAGQYVPHAVEAGALVIDCSSQFRGEEGIPLIVPDVNFENIKEKDKIICCPNPSTVLLSPVLKVLHEEAELKRVVVSAYEAVSGAGKIALDELWSQTLAIFNQHEVICEAFQHQIAFNCIPQVDLIRGDGYTKEEYRILVETRRILRQPELPMTVTAVRVPVFHCFAFSLNVETMRDISPDRSIAILQGVEGIEVAPDPMEYPMQFSVTGSSAIHVGRIRRDTSLDCGLNLWVVGDNVRRGAARSMVRIAELLIEKFA